MLSSREATLKALENFSRWMDIRKRYKTSVGGKYLSALMREQDGIKDAFEDFKKEFFLNYSYSCFKRWFTKTKISFD